MPAIARGYRALRQFIMLPPVTLALIGINVVAGIIGGIYWYGPELLKTPPAAMIFVPDCPLFTFLFAVALIGIWRQRASGANEWTLFNAITTVGLIKYGLWTITVWVLFWRAGYPATPESVLMTIAHVGMALEGVMLASFLSNLRWRDVLVTAGWFFLSDWVDYGLGFRPRMVPGVSERFMMWEMLAATALLCLFLGWLVWRRKNQPAANPQRLITGV